MVGRVLAAAAVAVSLCSVVRAADSATPTLTFETSERVGFRWTEIADFQDTPKAWDGIVTPEFAASLSLVAGSFQASAEIGALADRFDHFGTFDADSWRLYLTTGWSKDDWSAVLEWERFDVYAPGYGTFYVGFDTPDIVITKSFSANIMPDAPTGQFTASLVAGVVNATYAPLDTRFASFELGWSQSFAGPFALTVAPKFELDDFPHFSARHRRDAVVSLKLVPSYAIGDHITLSLEGKATVAFSTLETKTGETWEITPIFRFQAAL